LESGKTDTNAYIHDGYDVMPTLDTRFLISNWLGREAKAMVSHEKLPARQGRELVQEVWRQSRKKNGGEP
jgi:hypothetical protein